MKDRVSLLIDQALSAAAVGAYELAGLGFASGYAGERWLLAKLDDRQWARALREAADIHRAFTDLALAPWTETDDLPIDMYPTSPPTEWPNPFVFVFEDEEMRDVS